MLTGNVLAIFRGIFSRLCEQRMDRTNLVEPGYLRRKRFTPWKRPVRKLLPGSPVPPPAPRSSRGASVDVGCGSKFLTSVRSGPATRPATSRRERAACSSRPRILRCVSLRTGAAGAINSTAASRERGVLAWPSTSCRGPSSPPVPFSSAPPSRLSPLSRR
ncbi:hypothetical protein OH76DRAFT_1047192 [Lentinus brumalis]|uniref:Uncharacterized protein n=1 Tax=Lentinus brumalis TaxID=2498619 RepID=A0A371CWS3_9APHY|nr:hypothetical protein OH76DRAFT_1047192 [Polyporus brumalis]